MRLVEFVEEGQRDVLVLLVCELPVDPFAVVQLEVLEKTEVDLHC